MAKEIGRQKVRQGRSYKGRNLREIAFPLGGIGTGTVSLTGVGGLAEWQIKGRPDQDSIREHCFFALWAREQGQEPVAKVLAGPVPPPFSRHQRSVNNSLHPGGGLGNADVPGLPRMDAVTFRGEYPFAHLDYRDARMPVKVSLEAYNPLIPMDPDDSGIPCAIFNFTVTNRARHKVDATVALTVRNPVEKLPEGGLRNSAFQEDGLTGVSLGSYKRKKSDPKNGTLAVATPWRRTTHRSAWRRLGWFDALQDFWDEFSRKGMLTENAYRAGDRWHVDDATLGLRVSLKPGESAVLPIWLAWSFPNFEKYWEHWPKEDPEVAKPTWKNYYAHKFPTALAVARYLKQNAERLHQQTLAFHDALFSSTLPEEVLDAVSSQISILRSTTCIRLPDGTFYGFEGCNCTTGCCSGSCTHVWNYAQALPFLFPSLERSVREADYASNFSTTGSGAMAFRIDLPLDRRQKAGRPAADGQLGGIIKTCREWKFSGDTRWLRKLWPSVVKSLEFAWKYWDYEKRGVVDGLQHNTYDIEFYGPNTLVGSFYLGALRAGEVMAEHLGESEKAAEYRALRLKGAAWMDRHLFNGEYYEQKVRNDAYLHAEFPDKAPVQEVPGMKPGEPKYQYGPGCLSDQMIGQWLSHVAGLGHLFDPEHVKKAVAGIYRHNFRKTLAGHSNCQRVYAIGDEAALLLCTWPRGGRPALPFPYCDEAWTGIEYQVASHLIYEGLVEEGLRIVQAVRARHDGVRRNPWNEFECGSYYARAMASYSVLLALSGFSYDGAAKMIGFAPRVKAGNFSTFWSAQEAWGTYRQKGGRAELDVLYGSLSLKELAVGAKGKALLNGKRVEAEVGKGTVRFAKEMKLGAGDRVVVG